MKLPAHSPEQIPRLPVFGWASFSRRRTVVPPSILESPHRLFTTSGRASIALALKALGIKQGDRVLVPTYHCPTMIAPAVRLGADPLFFPTDAEGNVCLDSLRAVDLTRTKAMLAVHYFGIPKPMAHVREFCDAHGIALIEDCAHTMFGEVEGRPVGAWGDFAIASLTKFFPIPEGGCLVSASRDLTPDALESRGLKIEIKALVDLIEPGAHYGRLPGVNKLLTTVIAAKRLVRNAMRPSRATMVPGKTEEDSLTDFDTLPVLGNLTATSRWVVESVDRSRIVSIRRRNYLMLAQRLGELPGARVLYPRLPDGAVPYVFPLWVDDPDMKYSALKAAGVPLFRWDRLWPGTASIAGDWGLKWSRHIFQLPCHQDLTMADLDWLVETLFDLSRGAPSSP